MRSNHKHDRSHSITIEIDNVTFITNLIIKPDIRFLRFDKKLFFHFLLDFLPYWVYKSYESDYYNGKKLKINYNQ